MRKDSEESLPNLFEDPILDHLAYLTFVEKEDQDIHFSFLVDLEDN